MNIAARFYVESVTDFGQPDFRATTGTKSAEKVVLQAIYSDDKDSPNYSYSQATPQARVELTITNKDVWGAFKPGHSYDAMFVPTPPGAKE